MTHLAMEQLLALREPASEPGTAAARAHLEQCAACRAELDRLEQRVARLRALPTLSPARDQFPAVRRRLAAARRARAVRWALGGAAALAAGMLLAVALRGRADAPAADAAPATVAQIDAAREESQALEATLRQYRPEVRVLDGRTARIAAELEDRIARVDADLEVAELIEPAAREARLLRLWRERVGLMDALVDVHVTRARHVGL